MTGAHIAGCIILIPTALCAFTAYRKGEWASVKRANEALNHPFGDQPNVERFGSHNGFTFNNLGSQDHVK